MNIRPSILCPIDFSAASGAAMRCAAAIAERFSTRLIVLTVEDPFLAEAADLGAGIVWSVDDCERDMQQFVSKTFGEESAIGETLEFEVAVGKPAVEILRVARERSCELIVMSTHGLTGMRKLFFGSTTERVLRETTKPVLLTPAVDSGPIRLDAARQRIHRTLVAVDLSPASLAQAQSACRVAEALDLPVLLVHVVEPLKSRLAARLQLAGLEADRRAVAEEGLAELLTQLPGHPRPETLVAYGDPAEEIAKVARDRQVGLIIVGLHGSPVLGPRMGSVTYRLLCVAPTLVLALPPVPADDETRDVVGVAAVSDSR